MMVTLGKQNCRRVKICVFVIVKGLVVDLCCSAGRMKYVASFFSLFLLFPEDFMTKTASLKEKFHETAALNI